MVRSRGEALAACGSASLMNDTAWCAISGLKQYLTITGPSNLFYVKIP